MPGIAGIVDLSNDEGSIKNQIAEMVSILDHTSPANRESFYSKKAAFGVVNLKKNTFSSFIAETQSVSLSFWGTIFDLEQLYRNSSYGVKKIGIGPLLVNLYEEEGVEGLTQLNGRFTIAIWDKSKEALTIVNDRYGFTKLYYWIGSQKIVFASEYKAILCQKEFPKKISKAGITDFMLLGHCSGNRTFFEEVKLLEPASIIRFDKDGNFTQKKYWDFSFHSDGDPVFPESHYLEGFIEKLTTAVKRQVSNKKRICLPISGGLDSRTLAGVLHKIGYDGEVRNLSYGNPYCYDVVYGKKISQKLGFSHKFIPIQSDYINDLAEKFVWLTEGSVDCMNSHMLLTHPFIETNNLDGVMTGFLGDTISGSGSFLEGVEGDISDAYALKIQYELQSDIMKDKELSLYLKNEVYEKTKGITFRDMEKIYYQCNSRSKYFRTRYINIYERQRRYSSFNLYLFDFVSNVIAPFLDYDFVSFILKAPPTIMLRRSLYIKMIRKYLPEVASIPYNKTKLPLNASRIQKGMHWRWEKLNRNPLIRSTIGRHYYRLNDNYLNTDEAIRSGSRKLFDKAIRNNEFLAEFFNMDTVHELLDDNFSGKRNTPTQLTALLTLSLWDKLFVQGKDCAKYY